MKVRTIVACLSAVAVLSIGCNPTTRYKVLTVLFDGVPPPKAPEAAAEKSVAGAAPATQVRQVGYREHGPYAAKLCSACHNPGAFNSLVLPREQLCFKCHEFKLDKKYIHGPLASGGCTACHDPHSSQYRYFLVSESDSFCFRCHERQAVARIEGHAGIEEKCTTCHDAHMSDKKYLLK